MEEIWKTYKDTRYHCKGALWEVSNLGNVKRNGEIFNCGTSNSGYKQLCNKYLHRIVAELFIPNPENKSYIDHINTIITDNRAVNLRWVTAKENSNNQLTKQKMKQNHTDVSKEKNPMYGKHHSKETRKKQSEAHKGLTAPIKGKQRVYREDGTYYYS